MVRHAITRFNPTSTETPALAEEHGTPLYLYDLAVIRDRVGAVREAFPAVRLRYAVKANPAPVLLRAFRVHVDGLDVASLGELEAALAVGYPAASLSLAGPGKRDETIARAIAVGATIGLESLGEIARVAEAARATATPVRVRLRVNPAEAIYAYSVGSAGASPFGIVEENVPDALAALRACPDTLLCEGIHVHAGSQCFSAAAIARGFGQTLALARRLAAEHDFVAKAINLGGGFGVASWQGGKTLDLEALGRSFADLVNEHGKKGEYREKSEYGEKSESVQMLELELGRYLVADAGAYVARVVDVKESRGTRFVVVDGGLHHLFAATGAWGPTPARPPLLESLAPDADSRPRTRCTVVGCLCTPFDRLATDVTLPDPRPGDLLAWLAAGAYGLTASPTRFLGHAAAAEVLVDSGSTRKR